MAQRKRFPRVRSAVEKARGSAVITKVRQSKLASRVAGVASTARRRVVAPALAPLKPRIDRLLARAEAMTMVRPEQIQGTDRSRRKAQQVLAKIAGREGTTERGGTRERGATRERGGGRKTRPAASAKQTRAAGPKVKRGQKRR